jgi:hypothetical protein
MRAAAFSRSKAVFAMIAVAMTYVGTARQLALSLVPNYESRGKGGKRPRHPSRHFVAMDKRAAAKRRNCAK